jgi:retron-type reverse transcriptase
MRRIGHLYDAICDFENLLRAAHRARRGKRARPDVAAFHYQLEANLLTVQDALQTQTYHPGAYRTFHIRDPKPRLISAAPYRDRVVHHAVCQVIEPIFERSMIADSYAHRVGKGTHRAVTRCQAFAARYRYVLACDLEKYFPSIDHDILFALLQRRLKCPRTLALLRVVLDASNPQEEIVRYFPGDDLFTPRQRRRGLPIGNLTSQLFSNVYLTGFDHFVQETLRCPAYVRFADDFLLFADDPQVLHAWRGELQRYLETLRVSLHPRKCQVLPTRCGLPFLGWQVYPGHRRVKRSVGVRFQRRLRALQAGYATGAIDYPTVRAAVMSWLGHLRHGATWGLRRALLARVAFRAPGRSTGAPG